jgi:hypothetical protein
MLQTRTGKLLASKAKSWFHVLEDFAIFDFASNAVEWFTNVGSSTARAFLFISQVSHANATVHSTGGDE